MKYANEETLHRYAFNVRRWREKLRSKWATLSEFAAGGSDSVGRELLLSAARPLRFIDEIKRERSLIQFGRFSSPSSGRIFPLRTTLNIVDTF